MAHLEDEVWTEEPAKVIHGSGGKLGEEPMTAVVAVDAFEFEASCGSSRLALLFDHRHAGDASLHQPEGCANAGRAGSENDDVWASGKIQLFLHDKILFFHFIHNDSEEA